MMRHFYEGEKYGVGIFGLIYGPLRWSSGGSGSGYCSSYVVEPLEQPIAGSSCLGVAFCGRKSWLAPYSRDKQCCSIEPEPNTA